LGFSAFWLEPSVAWKQRGVDKIQITLVDCPGHASLVKTIIGGLYYVILAVNQTGAQIIDLMLLVVDVTKGIQTQTAECIVIGDVLAKDMIVVLNKVDLLPEAERDTLVAKVLVRGCTEVLLTDVQMSNKLKKALHETRFAHAPMIPMVR